MAPKTVDTRDVWRREYGSHMQRKPFAIVTLVVALLGSPLTVHGQSAPNVDWVSVLHAETDPRVQIKSCGSDLCVSFVGSPPPNSGTAALDRVTYGDIVGDGGTEAVVPVDSGGSIGEVGSLIYMLDASGTPHLVTTDGPGGNVVIDSGANELVSVMFDGDTCSSMRCPSLVRTGFKLASGVLQQQDTCKFLASSADQAHPQGTCTGGSARTSAPIPSTSTSARRPGSASSGPDLRGLKAFPCSVLVLPLDQPPYANWGFLDARVNQNAGGTFYTEDVGEASQGIGANGISIQGTTGGDQWDQAATAYGCQILTAYCYQPPDPAHRQGGAVEVFGNLTARGNPAYVLHKTFPSEIWELVWFDSAANVTYQLRFSGNDVITMFEPLGTWSQNNVSAAQDLAAMADQLTVWDGSSSGAVGSAAASSATGGASATAAGSGDPADVVRTFYNSLSLGDYSDAWDMLGPRFKNSNDFDSWVKGYATTQSVTVRSAATVFQKDTTSSVNMTIVSVDRQAGGQTLTQTFQGTWNLVLINGAWKLDVASVKRVG